MIIIAADWFSVADQMVQQYEAYTAPTAGSSATMAESSAAAVQAAAGLPSTTTVAAGAPPATDIVAQTHDAEMQAASAMMMASQQPVPTPLQQPVPGKNTTPLEVTLP